MKIKKIGLLPQVLIAIVLGLLFSLFMPAAISRVFVTFNSIFSNYLSLVIPLLIIALVAPAITEIGNGAGKLLLITVAIAYFSTILSGFFTFSVADIVYPKVLTAGALAEVGSQNASIEPFFTIDMKPLMDVTSAIVTAFIIGLSLIAVKGATMRNFMCDFRDLINIVISKSIIPLLPLYVFGSFLKLGSEGQMAAVIGMFIKVILIVFVLHITFLIFQFVVAGIISKRNPFKCLVTMLPAYATALGTMSSAATIPVTLAQVKKLGVKEDVADFCVPLCATIHLSCSMLKIVALSMAVLFCMGMPIEFSVYAGFIMLLAITMVAAPGVPGGAIMASLGLLTSMLGFDVGMQGIIIAIYLAIDGFGTAGNVTGDGAISLIVDKIKR